MRIRMLTAQEAMKRYKVTQEDYWVLRNTVMLTQHKRGQTYKQIGEVWGVNGSRAYQIVIREKQQQQHLRRVEMLREKMGL